MQTEADAILRARFQKALDLLDRVGDAAAEALMKGEAVVVPWPVTVEMVRASNPADDAQDLLAHFTLHEGIAAGRLDREGAVVKHGERDDLRRIAQNFADELGRISAAIGTDEFMPEGAPVPLETQVLMMKAALDRARSEVLDLRYVIAGVFLEENRRDISVQDKWKSALKAMTDVIVDGSVVSQGYAERIKRDAMLVAGLTWRPAHDGDPQ
jgi:hypothetical protein